MKKVASVFLCFLLLLSFFVPFSPSITDRIGITADAAENADETTVSENVSKNVSGKCGSSLSWTFNEQSGILKITGSGEMSDWADQTKVPWYGVAAKIITVKLPEGLTSIGDRAFLYCTNLINTALPKTLKRIGNGAFEYCDEITSLTIPGSVKSMGESAFRNCGGLKSVVISNGVPSISSNAFAYCTNLRTISVPESVKSIGIHAFWSCVNLASFNIPKNIESIGYYAFADCTELKSITIPENIAEIDDGAFSGCTSLNVVNYNAVGCSETGSADDPIFKNCTGLTTVNIGSGVRVIPNDTFSGCSALTAVRFDDNGSLHILGDRVFADCTSLKNVRLPKNTDKIGDNVFSGCTLLETLYLSSNVTSIGDSILFGVTGCAICSDSKTSKAKEYADQNGHMFELVNSQGAISSIEITTKPTKTVYAFMSKKLDLTGLKLRVRFENGTSEFVSGDSGVTVSGFNPKRLGKQTVNLYYSGQAVKMQVTVRLTTRQIIIVSAMAVFIVFLIVLIVIFIRRRSYYN
ncbi:MAG: leucine-rich repeat protein [Clostridiales bacterium]|nr:leucine-rich repeat protein [Clostridiales bacterium]